MTVVRGWIRNWIHRAISGKGPAPHRLEHGHSPVVEEGGGGPSSSMRANGPTKGLQGAAKVHKAHMLIRCRS